jgi:DNA/RNA-binding domain of Phe-tRNA-synthetase-like protein
MELEVVRSLSGMGITVSTRTLHGIEVKESRKESFKALARELKLEMRERFPTLDHVRDDRTVRALRQFYWSIGIDPTKTRPSSEALLRRLLKKELPMINNLVDAGNLASVRTIIPIGIYDMDMIEGGPVLRPAVAGERFVGIGGVDSELEENIPVLSDDAGVIHLYPHRDCMRTRITENTINALVVACGARGIKKKHLDAAVEDVEYFWRQLRE